MSHAAVGFPVSDEKKDGGLSKGPPCPLVRQSVLALAAIKSAHWDGWASGNLQLMHKPVHCATKGAVEKSWFFCFVLFTLLD
jgi:hypothetical protein